MSGFDEYYNIQEFPAGFIKEIDALNAEFSKKYPLWNHKLEVQNDTWPEGNSVRLNYGGLTLVQVSEIDCRLHKLFQKYAIKFEVTSGGFSFSED